MLKKIVLEYFKSTSNLATRLNISSSAISQWRDVIPEKNAYRIQYLTKGELKVDPKLYRDSI